MYGVVVFHYRRHSSKVKPSVCQSNNPHTGDVLEMLGEVAPVNAEEDIDRVTGEVIERGKGWGEILYQVAGQKCDRCSPQNYEMPLWYAEEAQKVRV